MPTTFSQYGPRRWFATGTVAIAAALGMWLLHKTFAENLDSSRVSELALLVAAVWAVGGMIVLGLLRGLPRAGDANVPGHQVRNVVLLAAVLCFGSLAGAFMFYDSAVFGAAIQSATSTTTDSRLLVLGVALITGAAEEIFFRVSLHRLLPKKYAPYVATVAYVIATGATGNAALVAMAAVLGTTCSIALQLTGRAVVPIIIHAAWTLTMVGLFPLLITA